MLTGLALDVRELTAFLEGPSGLKLALDRVSLSVSVGRAFALLGESGSGKTLLFHSLLGLHPGIPGVVSGEATLLGAEVFRGLGRHCRVEGGPAPQLQKNLAAWNRGVRRNLAGVLGRSVTLVPQDPLTSLPPFHRVERLLEQAVRMGRPDGSAVSRDEATQWLARVHMYGAEEVGRLYLHELSGGMAQRVALALALAPGPSLVVADEPTAGLDATLRVKVLDLLGWAAEARGVTLCLITHDMEAARLLARDVAILCRGRIVETGPADVVLDWGAKPKHPYTAFLLEAEHWLSAGGEAAPAPEAPPSRTDRPGGGCTYRDRCGRASDACAGERTELSEVGPGHWIACREATA